MVRPHPMAPLHEEAAGTGALDGIAGVAAALRAAFAARPQHPCCAAALLHLAQLLARQQLTTQLRPPPAQEHTQLPGMHGSAVGAAAVLGSDRRPATTFLGDLLRPEDIAALASASGQHQAGVLLLETAMNNHPPAVAHPGDSSDHSGAVDASGITEHARVREGGGSIAWDTDRGEGGPAVPSSWLAASAASGGTPASGRRSASDSGSRPLLAQALTSHADALAQLYLDLGGGGSGPSSGPEGDAVLVLRLATLRARLRGATAVIEADSHRSGGGWDAGGGRAPLKWMEAGLPTERGAATAAAFAAAEALLGQAIRALSVGRPATALSALRCIDPAVGTSQPGGERPDDHLVAAAQQWAAGRAAEQAVSGLGTEAGGGTCTTATAAMAFLRQGVRAVQMECAESLGRWEDLRDLVGWVRGRAVFAAEDLLLCWGHACSRMQLVYVCTCGAHPEVGRWCLGTRMALTTLYA
jgi:hypothetical protein